MTDLHELPEPERPAIPPGVLLGGRHRVPVIPLYRRLAYYAVGFLGGALLVLGALALARVVSGG